QMLYERGKVAVVNVLKVGSFIRDQRLSAKLSLRKAAGLAGVSIPYLSQIERGLRKPSAEIMQAIAKGLRISAESLYVQAGILEDRPVPDVATTIMSDPNITERQKQALIQIYEAFREETGRSLDGQGPAAAPAKARAKVAPTARATSRSKRAVSNRTASKKTTAATASRQTSRARAR